MLVLNHLTDNDQVGMNYAAGLPDLLYVAQSGYFYG